MKKTLRPAIAIATAFFTTLAAHAQSQDIARDVTKVPVVFSEGHDTDPRDRGRPVVLIAAALGVPPEVFREAFTHVHPAGVDSGGPTDAEARQNKQALMNALEKYGVTDERLNAVSNYYRYRRSHGELWPTKPAVANALVKGGVVIGYEVVSGGSGYSSVPTISVPGATAARGDLKLSFSKTFENNGAVSSITVPQDKAR